MQIKNWLTRSLIFGVAALTVDAAFPQSVEARTIGSGIALTVPSSTNCLQPYFGIWHNTCSSIVSLDIPLPVDATGPGTSAKYVYVGVYANGPQNTIGCRSEAMTKYLGVSYWPVGGAYLYPDAFPQDQINLPAAPISAEGALLVNCQVGADAWVEVVGWENRNYTGWP